MAVKANKKGLINEPEFWESISNEAKVNLAKYEEAKKFGDKSMADAIKVLKSRIAYIDNLVEQLRNGSLEPAIEQRGRSRAA